MGRCLVYIITDNVANVPLSQGSLDNIVTCQPCVPPFSTDGLVDYLIKLIVCEDKVNFPGLWSFWTLLTNIIEAFQLIDKGPFHHILTYLRPLLSDKDIPHCQTLHNRIIDKANLSKARLKKVLEVSPAIYCKWRKSHLYARMSLVRCHSPSMPGHHRLATCTCPSSDISFMVWALPGSCI